ncbi:MAG: tRNA-dihydrouridine synthase family protein [Clostridia bacterium]|nr:tRNA-dihydrouridine synthase family protein [Clostridia bacterium]
MKVKPLAVGSMQVKNNIFLAPMAGYTDYAFRHLVLQLGAGLTFTELVSAKGLILGGSANGELLYSGEDIKGTVAQIFGSDPYYMRKAIESDYIRPFETVDINMGCPVPKVFKNGEGSALLTDIKKAETIIKECVKAGKNITVKIRTGLKSGDDIATDYAVMAEQAGAKLITIHGRVREAYYSGEPDYKAIVNAKRAVSIPVIANGGIYTEEDADKMLENTGADGVMLARGGIANPFLFAKISGTKTDMTLKDFIIKHVKLMGERYPDKRAALEFRKFTPYYFRCMTGVKDIKLKINSAESTEEIIGILNKFL